jgi:hypothetical protein
MSRQLCRIKDILPNTMLAERRFTGCHSSLGSGFPSYVIGGLARRKWIFSACPHPLGLRWPEMR